ncbi:MAG: methylenetetrahydrofolate reductase C-terminal domain-containing protein [Oscillospiraceae bacterium]|nr:methylenetetrahydrofolate reductase C-terminal domain-containing protein [Oscillospiraceae bacterium]
MIVSSKKPIEELMGMLRGVKKVALVGCKSCASACAVGGEKECNEMKAYLESQGIEVVGIVLPDESCHKMLVRKDLKAALNAGPEAIVSMACGSGCQTVAQNCNLPVYPANNTLFVGQTERVGIFHDMCHTCGDCVLGQTGGICPVTKCAKGLVNGPCGGQKNGKCEVNPENDCAWILIYNKLKDLNQLDKMTETIEDKGYQDHTWPSSVNVREAKR